MARDEELDRLYVEQERAFQKKKDAYNQWKSRLDEQNRLYEKKNDARIACDRARAEMNREYDALHRYDYVWDEYKKIRDMNNPLIESLKYQADDLAYQMKAAFQRASDAYNYGDKSIAPGYSAEGKRYKAELETINDKIKSMGAEVKSARQRAESYGHRDSTSFKAAKKRFYEAKRDQDAKQKALNDYSTETKRRKEEYESAKNEFLRVQERFQDRLAIVKAAKSKRQNEEDRLMDMAGIPYYYRRDCKVRREEDGTVNFYFGGMGQSDGFGHGHISMDNNGKVTYNRDVFDKHGAENYTDFHERLKEYKNRHSTAWQIQDDSGDYIVKVKGGYLFNNPQHGKDPNIERTDFLLFPKDQQGKHAHVSIGDDTDGKVKIWHDVEDRKKQKGKN